jgi:RNA polymerase primary sigma factor
MARNTEKLDDRADPVEGQTGRTRDEKQQAPDVHGRSLDIYFREINRAQLLTRAEEQDLARRIRAGEKSALDRMVQANLRFVVSIAKQYANQGLPLEDLINEGNLGLIKAAHRFDEERGFKFISYAVWWIRQAMLQSLAEHSRIVRLPLNRAGTLYLIGRAARQLDQELGRAPSPEEIAARLNLPVQEVTETMAIANTHVSLDEPYAGSNDDTSLLDHLPAESTASPDEQAYHSALSDDLARAIRTLSERERVVLSMYFGLDGNEPMTLDAIGDKLRLTRERIRQIKEKAIDRLRHSPRAQFLQDHNEGPASSPVLQSAHGHRK